MANNQKPRVAVSGGSGFTGGALVRRLEAEGYPVRTLVRDPSKFSVPGVEVVSGGLTDKEALRRLVEGADTVFHIAAMFRTEGPLEEFVEVNQTGTMALLEAAKAAGVRRFVYCSTIGVHGHVADTPSDETAPYNPRDHYQTTKLAAELACLAEGEKGEIEVVVIRPCSIYGPGDVRMLKIFRMVQKGVFLFVGNGRPNFHPVYIDDLVQGFMLAMTTPQAKGEAFIIGGPRYLPLRDYIGVAAKTVGARPPKAQVPYSLMTAIARVCETVFPKLGLQPPIHRRRLSFYKHNRAFSTEKARRILGYQPRVDLDEGFRKTVDWYYAAGLLKRRG
ncbi:NAD-dependent epimerase/dehydratase family protein [Phenylobacterium sp. LjRoot225]|uniref:NAD-dependent epimerase/dehydratase family protein n=1 Tax=Phenylobacterium sp. LjRoot225 TaxID=3342285 RepID=UPI003ED128F0